MFACLSVCLFVCLSGCQLHLPDFKGSLGLGGVSSFEKSLLFRKLRHFFHHPPASDGSVGRRIDNKLAELCFSAGQPFSNSLFNQGASSRFINSQQVGRKLLSGLPHGVAGFSGT